jgi:hypothetical protein
LSVESVGALLELVALGLQLVDAISQLVMRLEQFANVFGPTAIRLAGIPLEPRECSGV